MRALQVYAIGSTILRRLAKAVIWYLLARILTVTRTIETKMPTSPSPKDVIGD